MRGGRRNMYNLTGQPGWMRLGYSPGWVGRSASGLGPCAEYFMTGRWPAAGFTGTGPAAAWQAPGMEAQSEVDALKAHARQLEQLLEQARQRLKDLEES